MKSLQSPVGFADAAVVGLAVAAAAAVGVAAADRTNSGIPFVLLCHTDRAHPDDDAAAAVVGGDAGGDCNGRWRGSKTSTAPVFGRAVLIHYCISLPTAIPPFVVLSHQSVTLLSQTKKLELCSLWYNFSAVFVASSQVTHNRDDNTQPPDFSLLGIFFSREAFGMDFNLLSTMEILISHWLSQAQNSIISLTFQYNDNRHEFWGFFRMISSGFVQLFQVQLI